MNLDFSRNEFRYYKQLTPAIYEGSVRHCWFNCWMDDTENNQRYLRLRLVQLRRPLPQVSLRARRSPSQPCQR